VYTTNFAGNIFCTQLASYASAAPFGNLSDIDIEKLENAHTMAIK